MKKILILFAFVFLSSCGSFPHIPSYQVRTAAETDFNADVFKLGGKGYVVLDAWNNVPAKFTVYNYFTLTDEKGERYDIRVGDSPRSFMLSPGLYKITGYRFYGSMTAGNTKSYVDLDFEDRVSGEFTVAAGEAVYLGQIHTEITSVQRRFFSRPAIGDITFETEVVDLFDHFNQNQLAFYEFESGKKLKRKLVKWGKTNV